MVDRVKVFLSSSLITMQNWLLGVTSYEAYVRVQNGERWAPMQRHIEDDKKE